MLSHLHQTNIHFTWLSWRWHRALLGAGAVLLFVLLLNMPLPALADVSVTNDQKALMELAEPYVSPTNGLGSWIWADKTEDNQTCQFWHAFDIPLDAKVAKARLVMTTDNEFTLFLDGRELGRGAEWRELFVFDLAPLLPPGRHVLGIQCFNGSFFAGVLLGLRIDLTNGQSVEIKSDPSWRVVPDGVSRWKTRAEAPADWPAATNIASLGGSPWWTAPEAVNMMPSLKPIKVYFWQTGWFQVSLLTVCGIVILVSLRLMTQLALHRKERFLLQRERARIARDIHDDIGARMTQLVLHGELAQNEECVNPEIRQQLSWFCEEARGLLSTMDEVLWAVNPQRDTLRDFAAYVCKYAEGYLAPTKILCLFEVGPEMSSAAFDLPLRRSLLMAIKETLNNAAKHSGATELRLKIHWEGQHLAVVVEDNGKGFDPAVPKSERNGLANMVQRMKELGGHCRITSQPGQGCRVEFNVPLRHQRGSIWNWLLSGKNDRETKNSRTDELAHPHDSNKC